MMAEQYRECHSENPLPEMFGSLPLGLKKSVKNGKKSKEEERGFLSPNPTLERSIV